MDLETLSAISDTEFLPRKKCTELEKNHQYMVTDLKQVNTRYGAKVVAGLFSNISATENILSYLTK